MLDYLDELSGTRKTYGNELVKFCFGCNNYEIYLGAALQMWMHKRRNTRSSLGITRMYCSKSVSGLQL